MSIAAWFDSGIVGAAVLNPISLKTQLKLKQIHILRLCTPNATKSSFQPIILGYKAEEEVSKNTNVAK